MFVRECVILTLCQKNSQIFGQRTRKMHGYALARIGNRMMTLRAAKENRRTEHVARK